MPRHEVSKYFCSLALNGSSGLDLTQKSTSTRGRQKISRLRTKMKIARAVELRSSKFWMFWKATNLLFRLSTGFMGVGARYPAAPTPQVRGAHFFPNLDRGSTSLSPRITFFFDPKKVPSLVLNGRSGLDLEPKVDRNTVDQEIFRTPH